jgi:uncharacterized delta-60 repeat protein
MKFDKIRSRLVTSTWRLHYALLVCSLLAGLIGRVSANAAQGGGLDPSFGEQGMITTDFNGGWASAVSIQIDGRILAAGYSASDASNNNFAVTRYTFNGQPDITFGFNGKVTTDFNGQNDQAYAVVLQADQKIIVAGETIPQSNPVLPDSDFAVVRYTIRGGLDPAFGLGGKVTLDFGGRDAAIALAVQPDGKILIAGETRQSNYWKVALARLNKDGSLDQTFGDRGKTTSQIGAGPDVNALAIQPDGKLIVAGAALDSQKQTLSRAFLARYDPGGRIDIGFGQKGIVFSSDRGFSNSFYGIDLQMDGKIIAAGASYDSRQSNILLSRFNSDGSPDSSFGTSGKVFTDLNTSDERAYAVRALSDGSLLVAGYITMGLSSSTDFLLLRYTSAGTLDSSFGNGGTSQADFGLDDFGYAMALYSDGRAVVAGKTGSTHYNFALARFNNKVLHYPPRIFIPLVGQ